MLALLLACRPSPDFSKNNDELEQSDSISCETELATESLEAPYRLDTMAYLEDAIELTTYGFGSPTEGITELVLGGFGEAMYCQGEEIDWESSAVFSGSCSEESSRYSGVASLEMDAKSFTLSYEAFTLSYDDIVMVIDGVVEGETDVFEEGGSLSFDLSIDSNDETPEFAVTSSSFLQRGKLYFTEDGYWRLSEYIRVEQSNLAYEGDFCATMKSSDWGDTWTISFESEEAASVLSTEGTSCELEGIATLSNGDQQIFCMF
jgi:hypothetical protein